MAIYVNGLTPGVRLNELYKMMRQRGARIVQYLDRKSMVTHIVAHTLTPTKMIEFREYKVATPAWIIESVEAGKLLNWRNYSVQAASETDDALPFDDVAARRGAQVAGNNLFSMGIGKQQDGKSDLRSTGQPSPRQNTVVLKRQAESPLPNPVTPQANEDDDYYAKDKEVFEETGFDDIGEYPCSRTDAVTGKV